MSDKRYDKKDRNEYFQALQKKRKKCIISSCKGIPIESHTLSKSVLRKAQDGDNNFIWLQKESQTGINKLFTYFAFCGNHDNELFKKIDDCEYCVGNKEQEFLMYYRCLSAEYVRYFAKLEYQRKEKIMPTISGETVKLEDSDIKTTEKRVEYLKYCYKYFEKTMLEKNYEVIETITFVFDDTIGVVGAQFFDIATKIDNEEIYLEYGIVMNIFPQNGKTYVVISYAKVDKAKLFWLIELLDRIDNDLEMQIFISILALSYLQNIGFSKMLWASFSQGYIDWIKLIYKMCKDDIWEKRINIFIEKLV